jgi:hypothetical protein
VGSINGLNFSRTSAVAHVVSISCEYFFDTSIIRKAEILFLNMLAAAFFRIFYFAVATQKPKYVALEPMRVWYNSL